MLEVVTAGPTVMFDPRPDGVTCTDRSGLRGSSSTGRMVLDRFPDDAVIDVVSAEGGAVMSSILGDVTCDLSAEDVADLCYGAYWEVGPTLKGFGVCNRVTSKPAYCNYTPSVLDSADDYVKILLNGQDNDVRIPGFWCTCGTGYYVYGWHASFLGFMVIYGEDGTGGTTSSDEIHGSPNGDWLDGEGGGDVLYGEDGADHLEGGPGIDVLYGGPGADVIYGGDGVDYVYGGPGSDEVHGGADADWIEGEEGIDYLYGDAGGDRIYGGDADDWMEGGADDDRLYGYEWGGSDDNSLDVLIGGTGSDQCYGGGGANACPWGSGDCCNCSLLESSCQHGSP